MPSPQIPRRRLQRIQSRRGRILNTRSTVRQPPRRVIVRAPRRLLRLRRRTQPTVPLTVRPVRPPVPTRRRSLLLAIRRDRITPTPAGVVTVITGTSATTNANDTLAASGTTTPTGTSTTTNNPDTSTASGTTTPTGTSATTNANDLANGSGSSGSVTGTSDTTNANDVGTGVGTSGAPTVPGTVPAYQFVLHQRPDLPTITGSLHVTDGDDWLSAAGVVDPFNLLQEDEELLLLV